MLPAEIPSLLDDATFLAELQQFDRLLQPPASEMPIPDEQIFTLDHPVIDRQRGALQDQSAIDEADRRARLALARSLGDPPHRHVHTRAPTIAVALVFVLGILAGAGAATWVFQDRVEQIVAVWAH